MLELILSGTFWPAEVGFGATDWSNLGQVLEDTLPPARYACFQGIYFITVYPHGLSGFYTGSGCNTVHERWGGHYSRLRSDDPKRHQYVHRVALETEHEPESRTLALFDDDILPIVTIMAELLFSVLAGTFSGAGTYNKDRAFELGEFYTRARRHDATSAWPRFEPFASQRRVQEAMGPIKNPVCRLR